MSMSMLFVKRCANAVMISVCLYLCSDLEFVGGLSSQEKRRQLVAVIAATHSSIQQHQATAEQLIANQSEQTAVRGDLLQMTELEKV
jgi:type VI protein secretion system component VasF